MDTAALLKLLKKKADAEGITENFPPLTDDDVAFCEKEMGLQLPELLKLIYTEVASGGIGPGEAMIELASDSDDVEDVLNLYLGLMTPGQVHEDFDDEAGDIVMEWIPGVIPLFYWGGAVYTMLDCSTGMMVECDFDYGPVNYKEAWLESDGHFKKLGVSFFEFMASWVDPATESKYEYGADFDDD